MASEAVKILILAGDDPLPNYYPHQRYQAIEPLNWKPQAVTITLGGPCSSRGANAVQSSVFMYALLARAQSSLQPHSHYPELIHTNTIIAGPYMYCGPTGSDPLTSLRFTRPLLRTVDQEHILTYIYEHARRSPCLPLIADPDLRDYAAQVSVRSPWTDVDLDMNSAREQREHFRRRRSRDK